ncbi:MAG TPA: lipid-A-disaccharide synthase [Pseudomonadales bacterium]
MKPLHVGILAGESSGDILGAGLMEALRQQHPAIRFSGIGGPLMQQQGLASRVPMERLSVMGLVEPLKRLPELLRIRRDIVAHFISEQPDVFVGIDSPDFNLGVEGRLRAQGIRTVHYVSPSVWAWRQRRIRKIAAAVDLVLTLFPFEADFYRQQGVPVSFVGHPLADVIPMEPDRAEARARLGLQADARVVALLPGSRQGEVARMGAVFVQTATLLAHQDPALQFLLPCANAERKEQLRALLSAMPTANKAAIHLLDGQSRVAMTAADAVLLASGTAALEAMLLKRPMLVCYRMAPLSYAIISRMLKVPHFSLPNLLANAPLVEELVQDAVQPANLAAKMSALLNRSAAQQQGLDARYRDIHHALAGGASVKAATAVLQLVER